MSPLKQLQVIYPDAFFDAHQEAVVRSARIIVPLVLELVRPKTVIDVGCARGEWLNVFREYHVAVHGVDGGHINPANLSIPEHCFTHCDLSLPFTISAPGQFDLACCLEVGEHLPKSQSTRLVQQLVQLAPFVLFSAAVPGQGGTHHINEQWPAYWRALFSAARYRLLEIRPLLQLNRGIEWYYRQNLMMFVSRHISLTPRLEELAVKEDAPAIEWVAAQTVRSYTRPKFAALNLWRAVHGRIFGGCDQW
jgi:hypothetical protein